MKKNLIIAAAVSAALVSGATFADAKAITGVTMGIQAGAMAYQGKPDLQGIIGNYSERSGGFLLAGSLGYQFALSSQFAIGFETGVANGFSPYKLSTSGGSAKVKNDFSIPLLLTAKYVLPFGLNVFVKGGMAWHRYNIEASQVNPPLSKSGHYNKWTPQLAAGIGYQVHSLNIFAQYTQNFGSKLEDSLVSRNGSNPPEKAIRSGAVTIGVDYTFPM